MKFSFKHTIRYSHDFHSSIHLDLGIIEKKRKARNRPKPFQSHCRLSLDDIAKGDITVNKSGRDNVQVSKGTGSSGIHNNGAKGKQGRDTFNRGYHLSMLLLVGLLDVFATFDMECLSAFPSSSFDEQLLLFL